MSDSFSGAGRLTGGKRCDHRPLSKDGQVAWSLRAVEVHTVITTSDWRRERLDPHGESGPGARIRPGRAPDPAGRAGPTRRARPGARAARSPRAPARAAPTAHPWRST